MKKIEKRLELRTRIKAIEDAGGGLGGVEGYATTFDQTPDLDGDRVLAGSAGTAAFTVPMLAYHDRKSPVGSALMTPDSLGVRAAGTYANTQDSQDMRELVRAKAVPAFSIGFWSDDYTPNDFGGMDFKTIHIYEVSLVPIPANPRALVTAAKSLGGAGAAELQNEEKQYVDVTPAPGSFEATLEALRDGLRALYSRDSYVSIIATFSDRAVYSVESYPAVPSADCTWQVTYSFDERGELTLGSPEQVEVTQTIVGADSGGGEADVSGTVVEAKTDPADEQKAGRRNRNSDQKALDQAHDLLVQAGAICEKAGGSEDDDAKSKAAEIEAAKERHATSRPDLRLLTEIAEFEVTGT